VARWLIRNEPDHHTDGTEGRSRTRAVPFYAALLILVVGIAVAVFVILFFGAVLMLFGGTSVFRL
jgi:hypothetical protein